MKPTVSLTFDDGLQCQVDHVLPRLIDRGIPGTFFLATEAQEYPLMRNLNTWQAAASFGHEIGSHSVTHRKAAGLSPQDCMYETVNSAKRLEDLFEVPVMSFCYPYTDAPEHLARCVRRFYKQARGGRGARADKYLVPGDGANLFNVTCFHVNPSTIDDAPLWAAEVVRRKAWLTLMLHGVGDPQAWDNISTEQFEKLLDAFSAAGAGFATFADGANSYREG